MRRLILSTKPYRRLLFFSLWRMQKNLLSLNLNCNHLLRLSVFGNLGSFSIFIFSRNFVRNGLDEFLFGLNYVVQKRLFLVMENFLVKFLKGVSFGWMTFFSIEGYHYRAFLHYLKRLRKYVIIFKLGFFYNLMLVFPKSIKVYWKKRLFKLRGSDFSFLYLLSLYIRMVRNLFPYKVKGIIYDNYSLNKSDFEKKIFTIKQGKKSKLR